MMKRKLFFLFDRLKISRNERMAVSVLMIVLVILIVLNIFTGGKSPFDKSYYQQLDNQFKKRTVVLKQKEKTVMARYHGISFRKMEDQDSVALLAVESHGSSVVDTIDLNKANAEALQELPGIGPAFARRIIRYRKQHGFFKTSNELLNVKGIGSTTLHKLLPYIYIESSRRKTDRIAPENPSQISKTEKPKMLDAGSHQALIDINTAGTKELQTLPGIGPAYARRIIAYRKQNGFFKTPDELLKIKGIGPATLNKMKPFILLKDEAKTAEADSEGMRQSLVRDFKKEIKKKVSSTHQRLNINTANAQELQTLPGIGPAFSQRIIAYRQKNGSFNATSELLKIKGIGKKTLAKIKPFIKLRE